jgi:hypothetical protein
VLSIVGPLSGATVLIVDAGSVRQRGISNLHSRGGVGRPDGLAGGIARADSLARAGSYVCISVARWSKTGGANLGNAGVALITWVHGGLAYGVLDPSVLIASSTSALPAVVHLVVWWRGRRISFALD